MRLVAENLAGERGGETIFRDVTFSVNAGEALVVTGPNGSGKSTLLRIVCGLLAPEAGCVSLSQGEQKYPVQAACHYLGHQNAMKPALSVQENLGFWQKFNGDPHLSIDEALEAVDLPSIEHLPFGYLSTGQKRRVSIAKLLVSHRTLWVVDEPTAGLDKTSERRFAELMQKHLAGGGLILAATHIPLGLEGVKTLDMTAFTVEAD